MGTRIQDKSRPSKRPQALVDYSTGSGTYSWAGRMPKVDPRGFPEYGGIPSPVLVDLFEIA